MCCLTRTCIRKFGLVHFGRKELAGWELVADSHGSFFFRISLCPNFFVP